MFIFKLEVPNELFMYQKKVAMRLTALFYDSFIQDTTKYRLTIQIVFCYFPPVWERSCYHLAQQNQER